MGKDSKDLKNLKRELNDRSISISKFLRVYYGIINTSDPRNRISHSDVKVLFPNIKRTGFEWLLKNKGEFYSGNVIPVVDSYGNLAPYINPHLQVSLNPYMSEEVQFDDKLENVILSEDLNCYELSLLCKEYKRKNRIREYRIANRILRSKKDRKVKIYKLNRDELILKGREENEKY